MSCALVCISYHCRYIRTQITEKPYGYLLWALFLFFWQCIEIIQSQRIGFTMLRFWALCPGFYWLLSDTGSRAADVPNIAVFSKPRWQLAREMMALQMLMSSHWKWKHWHRNFTGHILHVSFARTAEWTDALWFTMGLHPNPSPAKIIASRKCIYYASRSHHRCLATQSTVEQQVFALPRICLRQRCLCCRWPQPETVRPHVASTGKGQNSKDRFYWMNITCASSLWKNHTLNHCQVRDLPC